MSWTKLSLPWISCNPGSGYFWDTKNSTKITILASLYGPGLVHWQKSQLTETL